MVPQVHQDLVVHQVLQEVVVYLPHMQQRRRRGLVVHMVQQEMLD